MTTRIVTDANGRKHITNEPLLHPPQQEPVRLECVVCRTVYQDGVPPQVKRTWVGLTDEEIYEIGFDINVGGLQTMKAYKAIEAKLKEKNT